MADDGPILDEPDGLEGLERHVQGHSLPTSQAASLLSSFTTFLTLAIHSLLYHRRLYDPDTFLTARAYNLPVRQSRHPGVCAWITDAVAAVSTQLQRAAVDRVVFAVHAPKSLEVTERWVFDVGSFPRWDAKDNGGDNVGESVDEEEEQEVNWTDVNEALRGALRRVAYAAEKMPCLPDGCTFTLAIELHDEAPAPIGHPQDWIPSQPDARPAKSHGQTEPPVPRKSNTTPIRAVQAGPLFFECWIEHPKPEPRDPKPPKDSQNTTSASS